MQTNSIELKRIRILLACSPDLEQEELEFCDLILRVDSLMQKRGISLSLARWDHMQPTSAQRTEAYRKLLDTRNMCLMLYHNALGEHSEADLSVAYEQHKAGQNPRALYVFFKESSDLSPELKEFQDEFLNDYGHFYTSFEHVDTLRLEFLLQLERQLGANTRDLLQVEKQHVSIDGISLVNLDQIDFAAKNGEYLRLREAIEGLSLCIAAYDCALSSAPYDEETKQRRASCTYELSRIQDEFEQYQNFLFDLARKTSELSARRISRRARKAIRQFHAGDTKGANETLKTELLLRDQLENHRDYRQHSARAKEAYERIEQSFKDWLLKIDTSLADSSLDISNRIRAAHHAYRRADLDAQELGYPVTEPLKYEDFLLRYALFLDTYAFYKDALELNQQALTSMQKSLPVQHPRIATSYNNIAEIYHTLGDFDLSLEYHFKALDIWLAALPAQHPSIAKSFNNVAAVFLELGSFTLCLEFQLRAVEIFLNTLPAQHPYIATCYNNIAQTFHSLGDLCKSLKFHREALSIMQKALPSQHPDIATCLNNIAVVYHAEGDFSQSLKHHFEALAISQAAFPANHPHIAKSFNNIATVYRALGDLIQSLKYHKLAQTIWYELLPPTHPDIAKNFNNIAEVYQALGDLSTSLDYHFKALDINLKVLPSDHPNTASSYSNIATVYEKQRKYAKAIEYFNKTVVILIGERGKEKIIYQLLKKIAKLRTMLLL